MFLFKVKDRFLITRRGLVLLPGLGDKIASVNDYIKILKPDGAIIETKILGISFNESRDILIGNYIKKEDVPIESDVWLNEQ